MSTDVPAAAVSSKPAPVQALLSMTKPDSATSNNAVKRAPSLSELVQTIRAHNPEKLDKIRKNGANAAKETAVAIEAPSNEERHSMSTLSTPADKSADVLGTSPGGDGPRLRLPARLAAQAPMLSRSYSSNAMLQTVPSTDTSASSLPTQLSSLGISPAKGVLPSLAAIGERFAAKKQDTASDSVPAIPKANGVVGQTLEVSSSSMARSKSDSHAASTPSPTATSFKETVKGDGSASKSTKAAMLSDDLVFKRPRNPSPSPKNLPTDEELKLAHEWTLYYDSRATARAAQVAAAAKAKAAAAQSTSASHPSPAGHGSNDTYEAGLSTIGTFKTVQTFCRLYNWTKRPSRMGQNENLHLFKDGIMPMWEDAKNKDGGKWVLQVDVGKREEIDRFWTWLCLALVGEDFEDLNDEICGAVVSTRPRFFRIQLWVRNKDNISAVNAIGKRVLELLELDNASNGNSPAVTPTSGSFPASLSRKPPVSGIHLEFSYHSKASPPKGQFMTFGTMASAAATSSAAATTTGGPGSAFANFGTQPLGSKVLTPARPPGLGLGGGQFGMTRAASMGALAEVGKAGFPGAPQQTARNASWRERLGNSPRKPQPV